MLNARNRRKWNHCVIQFTDSGIWWDDRKDVYSHRKCLVINLDNGPSSASCRTQFIKRITLFAEANGLDIHLVYYPPYHSKYNPIERCWGALEKHWNGAILDS
ncbi:MAG: hypothetical protein GY701_23470, partial [Sulfitobacter sp.]|nr:hypothetical protein [Sulfitobacter sp.]